MMPRDRAISHSVSVTSIILFFAKHICIFARRRHEETIQTPSNPAIIPKDACAKVITVSMSARFVEPGLRKAQRDHIIHVNITVKCSARALVMVIPCCRYFFVLFRENPAISRKSTAIWILKLTVAIIWI